MQTDALDFALGIGLLQDGHHVAYESHKLKDTEWRYAAHEKKLLAFLYHLSFWRHYLLGTQFVVKIDNMAVRLFMTQPKLNGHQAR